MVVRHVCEMSEHCTYLHTLVSAHGNLVPDSHGSMVLLAVSQEPKIHLAYNPHTCPVLHATGLVILCVMVAAAIINYLPTHLPICLPFLPPPPPFFTIPPPSLTSAEFICRLLRLLLSIGVLIYAYLY